MGYFKTDSNAKSRKFKEYIRMLFSDFLRQKNLILGSPFHLVRKPSDTLLLKIGSPFVPLFWIVGSPSQLVTVDKKFQNSGFDPDLDQTAEMLQKEGEGRGLIIATHPWLPGSKTWPIFYSVLPWNIIPPSRLCHFLVGQLSLCWCQ